MKDDLVMKWRNDAKYWRERSDKVVSEYFSTVYSSRAFALDMCANELEHTQNKSLKASWRI